ncbi:putative hydrolase, alpha/beta hydrolase fold protein [Dictyobacter alpinus]|uniref:Putative hydrolase, alpha/beta hydrolase fold protein n=1 Tax=Dictyobacter alpinus TaxID=2014873 RepID=A0A402BIU3_9CHLR|nr:alpha/beta hydrolase [Dictyobacter alpinus]GCE31318.1 putative hydrolase, alpha/beta hydrolase fold protein [Dictyobacter alpinus]
MVALLHTNGEVSLPQGIVRYRDEGTGPTLVFIHGLLVNGALWRDVIATLSGQFRCIALDLPFGAHAVPLHADADLSPSGIAQLIADFLAALDLHDVTLVGNDTGGAMCQLTIVNHPERITRLILTNCDAFEAFFPLLIKPFADGARLFGTRFADFIAWAFQTKRAQRVLLALVSLRHADDATLDTYFAALGSGNRQIRRDVSKFLKTVSNRYTLEAAKSFQYFQHPVLIVWGKNDLIFSTRNARRLQQAFPHARLEFVPRSRAFVPEDQPLLLAQKIAEFMNES